MAAEGEAEAAKKKIEAAEKVVEAAEGEAEAAKKVAEAAEGEAEAAKKVAEAAKKQIEAAEKVVEAAEGEAEAAKKVAEAAKKGVEAAEREAEAAKREAKAAKKGAKAAKKGAEAAKKGAEAAAKTKAANVPQNRLNKFVSWGGWGFLRFLSVIPIAVGIWYLGQLQIDIKEEVQQASQTANITVTQDLIFDQEAEQNPWTLEVEFFNGGPARAEPFDVEMDLFDDIEVSLVDGAWNVSDFLNRPIEEATIVSVENKLFVEDIAIIKKDRIVVFRADVTVDELCGIAFNEDPEASRDIVSSVELDGPNVKLTKQLERTSNPPDECLK